MTEIGRREGCPKRMVFGPCGGVRPDGRCEVAEHRCVFLDRPLPAWSEPPVEAPPHRPGSLLDTAARRPVVLTDLSTVPFDR
ncbi:MAG TPA: methylenetetrahydrofolate reductase C-terminal domain-containing protein, partial [Blastococcus sp.]|nr:methylenetetrahydrofolate reductase C-terminal domain-containing protein [Blastococcus sp.]